MNVCNSIFKNEIFDSWSNTEIKELLIFGKKIAVKPITYEKLKTLISYIKKYSKAVTRAHFVDELSAVNYFRKKFHLRCLTGF